MRFKASEVAFALCLGAIVGLMWRESRPPAPVLPVRVVDVYLTPEQETALIDAINHVNGTTIPVDPRVLEDFRTQLDDRGDWV